MKTQGLQALRKAGNRFLAVFFLLWIAIGVLKIAHTVGPITWWWSVVYFSVGAILSVMTLLGEIAKADTKKMPLVLFAAFLFAWPIALLNGYWRSLLANGFRAIVSKTWRAEQATIHLQKRRWTKGEGLEDTVREFLHRQRVIESPSADEPKHWKREEGQRGNFYHMYTPKLVSEDEVIGAVIDWLDRTEHDRDAGWETRSAVRNWIENGAESFCTFPWGANGYALHIQRFSDGKYVFTEENIRNDSDFAEPETELGRADISSTQDSPQSRSQQAGIQTCIYVGSGALGSQVGYIEGDRIFRGTVLGNEIGYIEGDSLYSGPHAARRKVGWVEGSSVHRADAMGTEMGHVDGGRVYRRGGSPLEVGYVSGPEEIMGGAVILLYFSS